MARSTRTALTMIGVILFVAMAVGLIVSSVLWRQAVDASQVRLIQQDQFITTTTNPNFVDVNGNIASLVVGTRSQIVVYPTFYTVNIFFSGQIIPTNGAAVIFTIKNVVPSAYPLPLGAPVVENPITVSYGFDTGAGLLNTPVFVFDVDPVLRTDLNIQYTPTSGQPFILGNTVIVYSGTIPAT